MGLLMRKRKKVEKPVTFKKETLGGNAEQASKLVKEMLYPSADIHGMGKYLCIGDFIALFCEETSGYVYSAQSSSINNELHIFTEQDRDTPKNIQNLQVVLFQVCIQNRYKLNKKLRKLLLLQEQGEVQESTVSIAAKNKLKVFNYKTSAEAENKDNDAEQKRLFGKKVRYGEIIQLRHVFTGKYAHSSTTQTSQKDRNNMKISLLEFNAKNAQFKILPRYKVKSEGEFVQLYDQVMLESVKSFGHYLHASEPHQIDHIHYGSELNLGVERSSFTLVGCFRDYPDKTHFLRGGSVIRLFHKELEAYLIADGSFHQETSESVYFRIRAFDPYNPKTISPSTSGVTYWQVESESSILDGDVIKWEQQIRLRHMTTRKYLFLDNNLEVHLTDDNRDPRTVFRFHSVIKELDDIKLESYARIEHMLTGSWLHALKDQAFDAKDEEGTNNLTEELSTDTTKLRRIFTSTASMYADAYTIQHVPPRDVQIFNYIAGIVPFLVNLIKDLTDLPTTSSRKTHSIVKALQDVKSFLLSNGQPIKDRQKLLRNLKVIDLLVELVQCPLQQGEEQLHRIRIFKEAYDVLHAYMIGKSGKNALYMAKYIDFFQTQFKQKGGIGINVAQMLVELMRDNRKIVDRITTKHIDSFIRLLGETKSFRFLNLLEVLCVCDGIAIPNNQTYITEKWLRQNLGYRFYTARGQNINKEPNILFLSTTNKETWIPVVDISCDYCEMIEKPNSEDTTSVEYKFLLHQLDLLKALCCGRNDFAVHVITREKSVLPWEDAYLCLTSTQLPDQLRAKYCEVIIAAFVEVGSNYSVLDQPELCFVYEFIGTKDDDDVSEEEQSSSTFTSEVYKSIRDLATLFPVMRDFIVDFIHKNNQMVASDIGRNQLIEQVLCLLKHLVRFGYFSDLEEITQIMKPVTEIIDGTTDVPFPKDKAKGYSKDSQKVVNQYIKGARYERGVHSEALINAKYQGLQVIDFLLTFQRNLRLKTMVEKFKFIEFEEKKGNSMRLTPLMYDTYDPRDTSKKTRKNQQKILKELREMFNASDIFDKEHHTKILMDMSEYDYDKMVTKSLDILNKAYSSQSDMFRLADKTQLLTTSESIKVHCDIKRELPVLQRFVRQKANDSQIEIMCNILDEFIRLCKLQSGAGEPHFMNQHILLSHGILDVVREIFEQDIDTRLEQEYSGMKMVLSKTFGLIQVLAKDNKDVQENIFYYLDMLLDVKLVPSDLALALKELFVANQTTCLKITETQIKKIVLLACEYQEKAPEYLELLYTLVKVEGMDLNVKRNQSLVMKYVMQNYSQSAYVLEKSKTERETILTKKSSTQGHLLYYVKFVHLISVCAEGENKFIESLCQTMIPIEELLWVLNHPDIDNIVKRPFVKFMNEVYLHFAGEIIESGAADLQHNKKMWEFLDKMARCMERVVDEIEICKDNIGLMMKQKPDESIKTSETSSVSLLVSNIYFIDDALIPFLRTYFSRVYAGDEEIYPDEVDTANNLALSVANFSGAVSSYLRDPHHMKDIMSALTVLIPLSSEPKSVFQKILDQIHSSMKITETRSDIRKGNMIYYAEELQLNGKFRTFAKNCNVINKGINTVKHQTGFASKREYSCVGLSSEMPLGEEFQSLVRCFINTKEKKPDRKFGLGKKLLHQLQISSTVFKKASGAAIEYDDLDIKCLQILRAFIHNEERKLPENVDAKAGEASVKRQLAYVRDVQNAINEHDFVQKVLPHIARRNESIVREVLNLISGMLYNANRTVQKCMLQYFLSTREELFFMALRERMVIAANSIKEKRSLYAQHQAKSTELLVYQSDDQDSITNTAGQILEKIQMYDAQLKKERIHGWMLVGKPSPPIFAKKKMKLDMHMMQVGSNVFQNGKLTDMDVYSIPVQAAEDSDSNTMSTMMEYNDDGYIELVLELLARVCDGQNSELQNYLREQPDNVKSFNIVAETTQFLNVVYSSITDKTIELTIQVFSTLNEFCAGNQENRVVLYGNKIVDYINFILRTTDIGNCPPEKILELRQTIAILILSMIEENGPEKTEVAKEVKDTVDKQALLQFMKNCYEMSHLDEINLADIVKTEGEILSCKGSRKNLASVGGGLIQGITGKTKNPVTECLTDTGYLFYLIWARMNDLDPDIHRRVHVKLEHQKALDYYKKNCLSIEIVKDDVLQKVNFRAGNKSLLREEVKETLKWNVDRTSPSNKIRDLMGWTSDILKDISYQRKILQKPITKIFTNLWLVWNFGAFFLSVAINLMMLYTWNAKASLEDFDKQKNETIKWHLIADPDPVIKGIDRNIYDIIMYSLEGTHNFFSLMMFISYMLLNHPRFPTCHEITAPFRSLCKKTEKKESSEEDDKDGASRLNAKFFSFRTFYFLVFLAFSVLGTVYNGYFFSFHLLNIVVNNQLLSGVIRAVTQNGWSLFWVAILGLIVIYIYALIGFSLLRAFFDPANYLYCHTLWQCTITVVRYGLIGDMFDAVAQNDEKSDFASFWPLVLYHVTFFIFITTIGLNIIFGIIVDTFSELRDLKWRAESDMRECCFICGRNSYDFEHTGKGFRYHVQNEHSMWTYIYFFIHLDNVKPCDYTALELFVAKLWKKEDYDFFPINRALCLASADADVNESKIEEVLSKVELIHTKQQEEDIERKRRKEKLRQKRWHERHRAFVFDAKSGSREGTPLVAKQLPHIKTEMTPERSSDDPECHSLYSEVESVSSYDETVRRPPDQSASVSTTAEDDTKSYTTRL